MNERILELIKQATVSEPYYPAGNDGHPEYRIYMCKEKFAELIVKECMAVAKYHTPNSEECEYTWLIHDKIKEHFGVEE